MTLIELFLLWSVIAYDSSVCVAPRLILANGTDTALITEKVVIIYGNPLELYCTGYADDLEIYKSGEELAITAVNETTVKFFAETPERQDAYYCCKDTNTKNTSGVRVVVDSPPMVTDFKCKSYNLEYLNCSWTSSNIFQEYSLSYIKEDVEIIDYLLCRLKYDSTYFVWTTNNSLMPYQQNDKTLTFVMDTCNYLGCGNQTFAFNHVAIIEPASPEISLVWKTTRSALLMWHMPWKLYLVFNVKLEHSMTYSYMKHDGMHTFIVNTSSFKENYIPSYQFELELPCSGTFYEVKLSIRPKIDAEEKFWSEEAVISFVTDPEPENTETVDDPKCTGPRVTVASERMLHEIEKLRDKIKEEQKVIRESIRSMKLRIVEINQP